MDIDFPDVEILGIGIPPSDLKVEEIMTQTTYGIAIGITLKIIHKNYNLVILRDLYEDVMFIVLPQTDLVDKDDLELSVGQKRMRDIFTENITLAANVKHCRYLTCTDKCC